ncbi:MAG: FlgD immunoglobulin-like domain containing protein [Candidatus Krumholzibacteriia bacterium]
MNHPVARRSPRLAVIAAAALLLIVSGAPLARAQADANWSSLFGLPGTDGEVLCSTVWNGNLVVGGYFGVAGTGDAAGVALWDGTQWIALGAGLEYAVRTLGVWNGSLYAGGWFTSSGTTSLNGVARWTGSAWEDVGGGINGAVYALLATPTGLVVAGDFDDTYAVPGARNIARWNGTSWSALGDGLEAVVNGLALHAGQVAAVGDFPARVALFNGSFWEAVGGGLPDGSAASVVNAVASHGGQIYVGGAFDPVVGETQLNNIASWDGAQWSALQSGLDGPVQAFGEWDGKLVIGGSFLNPIFHLGTWDGYNFEYLGGVSGVGWYGGDYVNTIATSATRLYVGGVLTAVYPSTYGSNVFAWDGSAYASLGDGNGLNGEVQSIGKWNGSIYAGGGFNRSYSDGNLSGIARWTGTRWESLAGGLQTSGWLYLRVNGFDTFDDDLVVTGQFTGAGGGAASNIARWNGAAWSTFGSGFGSETYRSAVYQNQLWVAGGCEELQGHASGQIWKWSGTNWQSQANDVGVAFSLVVWNGKLILGGVFSSVAGVPANCVAQWNGTSWSPLGAGLNAAVSNLIVYNNELYASGEFWLSGTNPVQGIARWTGTQWVPVGGAVSSNFAAHALGSGAGSLWMGGSWDQIGSTAGFNNIARWDGSWHPLGSGTDGPVKAVFVDGTDVWVGGMFAAAGGKISLRIARWSAPVTAVAPAPPLLAAIAVAAPSPNPSSGQTRIAFSLPEPGTVRVSIVDLRGRLVASLPQGDLAAGEHAILWDGRARDGGRVGSGVYRAVIAAGGRRGSTRIVRVK